mgnify:CR=1 FL=1
MKGRWAVVVEGDDGWVEEIKDGVPTSFFFRRVHILCFNSDPLCITEDLVRIVVNYCRTFRVQRQLFTPSNKQKQKPKPKNVTKTIKN